MFTFLRIYLTVIFFSLASASFASTEGWKPFYENGKWGYKNGMGVVVIQPSLGYEYCEAFHDDLALVRGRSGHGYIDKNGTEVIPAAFYRATSYYQGRAVVQSVENGKWFFIDKTGKKVFRKEFDNAWCYLDSVAVIQMDTLLYLIDWNAQIMFEKGFTYLDQFQEGFALVKEAGADRFTYINRSGVPQFGKSYEIATSFYRGKAWVSDGVGWYLIDAKGQVLKQVNFIPRLFSDPELGTATIFNQGLCCVRDTTTDKYFYVNENYERISSTYDYADAFGTSGYARVYDSYGAYYINSGLKNEMKKDFVDAWSYYPGFNWVMQDDSLWYVVNDSGTVLNKRGLLEMPDFVNDFARVQYESANANDTAIWFINDKGENVFGPYAWAGSFSRRTKLAPVKDTLGARYFIDVSGNKLGEEQGWTQISVFKFGYAVVGNGDVEWYVDSTLNNDFHATFNEAWPINDSGFAKVEENYGWGLINKEGKIALECRFPSYSSCPSTPYRAERLRTENEKLLKENLKNDSLEKNLSYVYRKNRVQFCVQTTETGKTVNRYNSLGMLISSTLYNEGRLISMTKYKYNDAGNVAVELRTTYGYIGNPTFVEGFKYEYEPDSTGLNERIFRVVHAHHELENQIWKYYRSDSTTYFYDEKGRLYRTYKDNFVKCSESDSASEDIAVVYVYDDSGKLAFVTQTIYSGCRQHPEEITEYFYTQDGRISSMRHGQLVNNAFANTAYLRKLEYDRNGRIVKQTLDSNNIYSETKYSYFPNGLLKSISSEYVQAGKAESNYTYYIFGTPQAQDTASIYKPPVRKSEEPVKPARSRRAKRGVETLTRSTSCFEFGMVFTADEKFKTKISSDYYFSEANYAVPLITGQMGKGGFGPYFSEAGYIALNGINRHLRTPRFDWGMNIGFDAGALFYNMNYCKDFYSDTTTLGYDVARSMNGGYVMIGLKCGPNLSWRMSMKKLCWIEVGCVGKLMSRINSISSLGVDGVGYERDVTVKMDKGKFNRFTFCYEPYIAIRLRLFRIYGGWVMNYYDTANYTETWTDNGTVVATHAFTGNVNLSYFKVGLGFNVSEQLKKQK